MMRRPHLSTGAWIFASVVAAAVIAPTAVYAAASSTVAIGNAGSSTTATVTTSHQLLTTTIAAKNVISANGFASPGFTCGSVYVPPPGKAVVVTSVTYDLYGNTAGADNFGSIKKAGCGGGAYDWVETDLADETETRTFPIGLPMPSVGIESGGVNVGAFITGYLIPAGQLPAAAPATNVPARPARPTH